MEASPINNENIFLLRKANVWYTVCDGEWNNPNIWISNAFDLKNITVPQSGDTVYINHNVDYSNNYNTSSGAYTFNNTVNNLYINGSLTANGAGLNTNKLIVTGSLCCTGTIDFSTATSPVYLYMGGSVNYINAFNCGLYSNVIYNSPFDQFICPVTYYNIEISNTCTKYLTGDLNVNGTLSIDQSSTLQIGSFNYNVATTSLTGTLLKNSATGAVNFTTLTSVLYTSSVSFTGNPVVNISGNFSGDIRGGYNFGSNTLNITGNSTWTLTGSANAAYSTGTNAVVIASGKSLTIGIFSGANAGGWINNGSVTGADSTATLNIAGTYSYGNTNVAMPVGTFNYNYSGTSCIQVQSGVSLTLLFTSFYALNIQGTVSLSGNTTVSNNLTVSGSLQLASYNFTCGGTCSYSGSILKSGTGTVNFNIITPQLSTGSIVFASNPTVSLSGNITGDCRAGFNLGSGVINIISNLSIGLYIGGNIAPTIGFNILIASGVTLTNAGISATLGGINTTGTINGTDSTAIFVNNSMFTYQNATAPMATGKLYCNQAANAFVYGLAGNQNITAPSDPASPGYYNLTLNNSGVKTLLGNVSVKQLYTLTSPATLNTNSYALTNP